MKSKVKGVRLKGYLLEWAESLDNGDFSYHVKEALRQYLKGDEQKINNNIHLEGDKNNEFTFKQVEAEINIDDLEDKLNNF
ncbi:hypothetical protein [Halocella sp. SP3-1]|uniref:hypothetical protein n=1 Tax=Halocella sp. SP3-1 TaxID=2382161 RepID=UPI000F75D1A9|nr:hypothetical protein [Halocella sp. SP3-1]AZO96109.1 hypothetical protein D7D81_16765 [Halocella sp. SP3-1]